MICSQQFFFLLTVIMQYNIYIYHIYIYISEYQMWYRQNRIKCSLKRLGAQSLRWEFGTSSQSMTGDMDGKADDFRAWKKKHENRTVGLGMYYIVTIWLYITVSPWQILRNVKTSFWLEAREFGSCLLFSWGPLIVIPIAMGFFGTCRVRRVPPDEGKHVMKCGPACLKMVHSIAPLHHW